MITPPNMALFFLVVAFVLFVLGTIGMPTRINLQSAGLVFLSLYFLIAAFPR